MEEMEKRIVDLEITIAHQQDLLQQLSYVLYQQQKELDDLRRRHELLEKRVCAPTADPGGDPSVG